MVGVVRHCLPTTRATADLAFLVAPFCLQCSAGIIMIFDFASLSHPGQVRENNEDAVQFDASTGVAVLADGMGGYNAGEIASAMAVSFVCTELSCWLSERSRSLAEKRHALEQSVRQANLGIFNAAQANAQFAGMGTTIVAGLFDVQQVMLAHVGDSRCYLLRNGLLEQLTKDHSLLQEQLDAGLISEAQAKVATHRNLVTRAMGVDPDLSVDLLEIVPAPGDLFCICSDGLTDMIDPNALQSLLSVSVPLQDKAENLIHAANLAGGRDNISTILIQCNPRSGPSRPMHRIFSKREQY